MVIKIISNIMIVVFSTVMGMQLSDKLARRLYNIKTLRGILLQLETQIVSYSMMLPQAIKNSTRKSNSEWDGFFLDFASTLETNREDSMARIWQDCLCKLKENPFIGNEELGIMERFGVQFGTGDKKSQQKYFDLAQEQLRIEEENVMALKIKYSRMYRSLGLLLGLVIAIILL